ncbi:MAG: ABC transporter permease subunit [Oscillospiraceae bacterium]
MSLIRWELKKLLMRRSAKISLLILVVYAALSAVSNAVFNLASHVGSADGIAEIKRQYEYADRYRGDLTEDKLLYAYHALKTAYSEENMVPNEYDDTLTPSQEAWDEYVVPLGTLQYVLRNTYNCIPEYSYFDSILDVPESMVKDFYAVRDSIAEERICSEVYDEKDREFFLSQNERVTEPFHYDWYEGQEIYLLTSAAVTVITAFVCIILTAPIFASEYSDNTAPVIMSARYGRRKTARAKLWAALISVCAAYAAGAGTFLCGQLIFVGTRGLDCPIQLIHPNCTAPLTIGQAELYQLVLGFLDCIAMTLFTALVSSSVRSPFPAVVIPASVMILSSLISGSIPEAVSFISAIVPFMSNYHELLRTNMYFHIWSPYIIIVMPIIISAVCLPRTIHKFTEHQTA